MLENNKKEVFFEIYCPQCKNEDTEETKDPCNECLAFGWNIDSHKPIHFKEKDNAEKTK